MTDADIRHDAKCMPTRSVSPCLGRCGRVGRFTAGRCPACARVVDRRRGSAHDRGYGASWRAFRPQFIGQLVDAGVLPVCGAVLPGGPTTEDSSCKAQGLLTFQSDDGTDLHLDHEPPLQPHERQDPRAVMDPLRLQLLCRADHSRKTLREQRPCGY